MKRLLLALIFIISLGANGVIFASDISDATYYGTSRATNTGELAENVSVNCSVNTTALIDADIISSSANDIAIIGSGGADTAFMPGYEDNPLIIFYDSVPAEGNIDATLYTNSTGGKIRYFPDDEGMAVPDDGDYEPGDDFSMTISGRANTANGTSKNLITKPGAFDVYVSDSVAGNITASIVSNYDWAVADSTTGSVGWSNPDNAIDDDTGTYASDTIGATAWSDYLQINQSAIYTDKVRIWYTRENANINDMEIDVYYEGAWHNITSTLPGAGEYVEFDTPIKEITAARVRFYNADLVGKWAHIHEFDLEVVDATVSVTATGVESGDCEVEVCIEDKTAQYTYQVSSSSDDCLRKLADPYWSLTESFIGVGGLNATNKQWGGGMLFTEIAIPQGQTVDTAYLIFKSNGSDSGTTVNSRISAEDVDDAATFADNATTFDARWANKTTAVVDWDSIPAWTQNTEYDSVEIKTVIQEIVDRVGWASGQDMVIFWEDFDDRSDAGVGIYRRGYSYDGSASYAPQLYVEFEAPHLVIYIDGVEEDKTPIAGASVPDNSNDWVFFQNGAMDYVASVNMTVSSTPMFNFEWQYTDNFTDTLGNGYWATPTFRTTSNDSDVSASLISFLPVTQSKLGEEESQEWPTMVDDAPDEPSTAYTEESRPGIFFEPLVHTIWGLSGLPDSVFWYNFAFFIIIGAGMLVYYFFAKNNVAALVVKCLVMLVIMIFFALPGPNIYGMYVCIYFVFWCFGIIVLSKSYGW